MAGLDDLEGLFQPEQFYDSTICETGITPLRAISFVERIGKVGGVWELLPTSKRG